MSSSNGNLNDHKITLNVTGDELSSSVEYAMNFNLPQPGVDKYNMDGLSMISFSQTDTAGTDSFEVHTSGQKAAGNPGDGLNMYLKSADGMITKFQPYFITIGPSDDSVHTRIGAGGDIDLKSLYSPKLSLVKTDTPYGKWSMSLDSSNNLNFTFTYS